MGRLHVTVSADFSTLTDEQAFLFLSNYFRKLADGCKVPEELASSWAVINVPGDPDASVTLRMQLEPSRAEPCPHFASGPSQIFCSTCNRYVPFIDLSNVDLH